MAEHLTKLLFSVTAKQPKRDRVLFAYKCANMCAVLLYFISLILFFDSASGRTIKID